MQRTRFRIPQMDCAAEERLLRMAFGGNASIHRVDVDLTRREVTAFHDGDASVILGLLGPLNAGARVLESTVTGDDAGASAPMAASGEAPTLRIALGINAAMFVGESVGGFLADSSALIADSLDMFADAAVYAIALYGAGQAVAGQRKAARLSGWMQLALACGALFEVARRAVVGSEPESSLMMGVAVVALVANGTTMWLLAGHRAGGAHMKASWIFTTNDVIANCGVIVGGILVRITASAVPDLIVGAVIGLVVSTGAMRILKMARTPIQTAIRGVR